MNNAELIKEKLYTLESQLTANHPDIKGLLRDIHSTLKQDPDVVTILSEEEVSILVKGLMRQTNSDVIAKVVKTKPSKKSLQQLSLGDL